MKKLYLICLTTEKLIFSLCLKSVFKGVKSKGDCNEISGFSTKNKSRAWFS